MTYRNQRRYIGSVEAVIFDWAGTIADFGSLAPILAFQELFSSRGVPITQEEARGPMGTEKREHIRQLLALPRIAKSWLEAHGKQPDELDIDELYDAFVPMQKVAIKHRAHMIPGFKRTLNYLRNNNIKVGTNTGYSREMVNCLLPAAQDEGFKPDCVICATEVRHGRPFPHMSWAAAAQMDVHHVNACVKVDDTIPGIEEGLNAGMWTVAVAATGNEVGLDKEAWESLSLCKKRPMLAAANQRLYAAGAHYVIDSVAALPKVLKEIDMRLARGDSPSA